MTYVNITLVYLRLYMFKAGCVCLDGHQMPQDLIEHGAQSSATLQVPCAHCCVTLQQGMLGTAQCRSSSLVSCSLLGQDTRGKAIPLACYSHFSIPEDSMVLKAAL